MDNCIESQNRMANWLPRAHSFSPLGTNTSLAASPAVQCPGCGMNTCWGPAPTHARCHSLWALLGSQGSTWGTQLRVSLSPKGCSCHLLLRGAGWSIVSGGQRGDFLPPDSNQIAGIDACTAYHLLLSLPTPAWGHVQEHPLMSLLDSVWSLLWL